jgi:N-acetylglucosaminyldiphosphoundecaprenol N-acetyl-beta-D-mannosaminyltransferase
MRVDAVQIPDVITQMERWIREGEHGHYIVVANTHVIMKGRQEHIFRDVVNGSALTVPDGMPLISTARRRGFPLERRVYGPDLMWTFFEQTAQKGYRHFLYGSTERTLDQLTARLRAHFPQLEICGRYAPPFRPLTLDEDKQVVRMINKARPDVLWVGLGCPKQEHWMHDHRGCIQVPVMVGVGQAFDIFAGVKKQAPKWMREHGLEWLFRLLQEPRRLWGRYLVQGPLFLFNVLLEELGMKEFN